VNFPGSWAYDDLIWCSPFHEWQKIYQNTMESFSDGPELLPWIIGAEATIWSESIDEHNLDSRIFPRISALAERLWSSKFYFGLIFFSKIQLMSN
jgi:hypothetical protein